MTESLPHRIDVAPRRGAVEAVVAQIPLASHTRTLVVNGGTADDPAWPTGWVKAALRAAVNELAGMPGPVIVSGGTQAGLFARRIGGRDRIRRTGYRSGPSRADRRRHHTRLEPHHSHFLVPDVPTWGDELPVLMALLKLLRRRGPVVVLIAGGGEQTRREGRDIGGVDQRRLNAWGKESDANGVYDPWAGRADIRLAATSRT